MPEIFRKNIDTHSVYALWNIEESVGELLEKIPLRKSEMELFSTFMVESRRKQWLAYRILIRSMLDPENFPVEYDASGKPYLAGSRYFISVTHSGDLAAVIISSAGHAGIDIELVRPKILKVREKFLHESELVKPGVRDDYTMLTLAWCAKEALYKLYGHKGLDFKENIRLDIPKGRPFGEFRGTISRLGSERSFNLNGEQFGDYILVYAIDPAGQSINLT